MTSELLYHTIPQDYCKHLGGLRWSALNDAVETFEGKTFALVPEIGLFVEGFSAAGRLIHFGFVLHLLDLLGKGNRPATPRTQTLRQAFRDSGRPLRNAGAFCAELCRHVTAVADPYALDTQQWVVQSSLIWFQRVPADAEAPPLSPTVFEEHVLGRLSPYSYADLLHWLQHGRGPLKEDSASLVREVVAVPPPALTDVLDELTQRERLAGALPYVSRLVGALALPPRRLAQHELPMGGYSDVATRGLPEQILPSQLALDDLEFLRRFAAKELLFYRREEPHAQTKEELVLLVDQGVRTWGDVRLVLAAGVLALARRVAKTPIALRLAATSTSAPPLDCRSADAAALGSLLEASDLTLQPGAALERVLHEPADGPRDVVLLTHPRSLAEADVQAAARRLDPQSRLFAVTVDAHGAAQLAELRHGVPVPRTRFRIEWETVPAPAPKPTPPEESTPGGPWRGDVEPIGFPLRFGITGPLGPFAFDRSGGWFLASSGNGMLHVARMDGTRAEVLPRGFWKGSVLKQVEAVLGVADGFVVCGRADVELLAFHYDLVQRKCTGYVLGMPDKERQWHYMSQYHSVVVKGDENNYAVDLGRAARGFLKKGEPPRTGSPRELSACFEVNSHDLPRPGVVVAKSLEVPAGTRSPCIFMKDDGETIGLQFAGGKTIQWLRPLADGVPLFKNVRLLAAQLCGDMLAVSVADKDRRRLHLLQLPEGAPVADIALRPHGANDFLLSPDGRYVARERSSSMIVIQDIVGGGAVQIPLRGRYHSQLDEVQLGQHWLSVRVGTWVHVLTWTNQELGHYRKPNWQTFATELHLPRPGAIVRSANLVWSKLGYDLKRFTAYAENGLTLVVDTFGQLILLDQKQNLVAMFFVFRDRLGGWLPDGSRFGPADLTGGPETKDARSRFGNALAVASQKRKGH